MTTDVVVLVLAAGRGTRFGATKQLATIDGVPMVRHVVDTALAADAGPVVVVLGHDAEHVRAVLPETAHVVVADDHADGQARSLAAGIRAAEELGAATVVVLLGDEPAVTVEAVRRVADAPSAHPMVMAEYDGRPGHPVRLARTIFPNLMVLVGDRGARALDGLEMGTVPVDGPRPGDVDVPADLPDTFDRHGEDGPRR